jgi:elongation factor G
MDVEVILPKEYLGDVMNDIQSRRSEIKGIESKSDGQVIKAQVPLAEMFGYATHLRNLTQGRAIYTMQFADYVAVPDKELERMRLK